MPALGDIVKGAADSLIGGATKILDELHTSEEEKADIAARMASLVNERMGIIFSEVQARFKMVTDVIQADNASGDNYTKRARPTVVYFGLVVIGLNHMILPWAAYFMGETVLDPATGLEVAVSTLPKIELPTEFWVAWGGVTSIWTVGRSMEKAAVSNRLTRGITGAGKNLDIEL